MTPTETAAILRQFNAWRRDLDDKFEQPDTREISEAIDAAVEMIERIEAAEADALEQARLNGIGASREAALMAKMEAAERERDALRIELNEIRYGVAVTHDTIKALRAKIETMEKQEPVKIQHRVPFVNSNGELVGYSVWIDGRGFDHWPHRSLYLAPGAQPAPSIPEISDDLIEAIESRAEQSYRRHHGGIRGQQVTPADALSWHIIHATRDVLATAPEEAKP